MPYKKNYSDEIILAGLKDGNRLIESYFYNYLRERAFGIFCRHSVGEWQYWAMEECLSKSFMILQNKVQSGVYQNQNLEAFALGIIRNSYWDERRKWQRKAFADISAVQDVVVEDNICDNIRIVDFLEVYDDLRLIEWGYQLSDRDQHIFNMQLQGYSLKEIAEDIGLSHGSVRNIRSRRIREVQHMLLKTAV